MDRVCLLSFVAVALTLSCTGSEGTVEGDLRALGGAALKQSLGERHPSRGPFAPVDPSRWAAATWGPGAHFIGGEGSGLRVGVYSARATRILLEVYDSATGAAAVYDYWLQRGADDVWRAELESVPGKALYAFRAWGPNWPFASTWTRGDSSAGFITDVDGSGNRFNPNKVLYDPYASELSHDKTSPALQAAGRDGSIFGSGPGLFRGVPRRTVDTGPWSPKAVALADTTDFGRRPQVAPQDAIVYEAHVRGLTQHPSAMRLQSLLEGVPGFSEVRNAASDCRGTYRAAAAMAPYLKGLGINVLELLPIHESDNDSVSLERAGGNYWGYATSGFFAPDRRYACDKSLGGPTREFKEMVRALHAHGVEVWLDVVYNHTGEGGTWDASHQTAELTSLRGLDNAGWYATVERDRSSYWETTGCGNNVNFATANASRLVLDSLTYWARQMGVDGFRFDLANVLGRDQAPDYGFNPRAQLLRDIAALGAREGVEVIAEAWDIGSYGVGEFPAGWGEWNGRYRDASRRFLKGDTQGSGISYADAFYGDYNHYADQGGASQSVNFLVAHDGFTLADLMSYGAKTNLGRGWPFGPSDGGNDSNDSWDSGGNHGLRRQRFRNAFVWQFFSRGVPMIVYGDEFARTQNGNNNPYNLDSPATWNNYDMIRTDAPHRVATGVPGEAYHDNFAVDGRPDGKNAAFLFARDVIGMRRASPSLRQGDYRMSVEFSKADGSPGYDSYQDRAARIRLNGSAVGDVDHLLYVNMTHHPVDFVAPPADSGHKWVRVIDTAAWAEPWGNVWEAQTGWTSTGGYTANAWSIVVFKSVGNGS